MYSATQAIMTGPKRIVLEQRPLDRLASDEVLIRVSQCGLCAGEVDQWLGKTDSYPAYIGHEIAGVVESIADRDITGLAVGDHVVAWVVGGGFADRMIVNGRHVLRVPPDLAYPAVAEPLSCCVNAVERAAPALGDDVVVIGAGFMSLLILQLSVLKGARSIIVAGRRPDALERAVGMGATHVVNLRADSLTHIVDEVTSGVGADVTYEVTGAQEGLSLAAKVTRMTGAIAIVGYHQGGMRTIPLGEWNWKAFYLVNAHFREIDTIMKGMRTGIRLVRAGMLNTSDLITHRYPLHNIENAFRDVTDKPDGFVKAVIESLPVDPPRI